MPNFLNQLGSFFGIATEEVDDGMDYAEDLYNDEDEAQATDNVLPMTGRQKKKSTGGSNVVNLPSAAQMKMIVYHPVSYEDTQNIIDNLKSRKPVIVNMEDLEIECAQRILDFMAGAIYALNGTITKIARGIFVVAPNNYDVIGSGDFADMDYM